MTKPALIIMAAGMGSRYGGLKQIDPVGPNGEIIMDYSVHDALDAGFGKMVFIIKEEMEEAFKEAIGERVEKKTETEYVFQDIDELPGDFKKPLGREKPWGTVHAVLSAKKVIDGPFAVINADDFYGRTSFKVLHDHLINAKDGKKYDYSMVGFTLKNTLTEHGHVARGVCRVSSDGYLENIRERTKIQRFEDGIKYAKSDGTWISLPEDSSVSMNMWGFTPGIFGELEAGLITFLESIQDDEEALMKGECYLPNLVGDLVSAEKARVKVLPSHENWYGVTYKEDREQVERAIAHMVEQGIYPNKL